MRCVTAHGVVRRTSAAIVGLGLAVLLAGCGGSGSTTADGRDKAALKREAASIAASASANAAALAAPPSAPAESSALARANAVCAVVTSYNRTHPNPYPNFNPLQPDPAMLKKVGAYFSASPYVDATAKLLELPVPTTNPQTWQTFSATVRTLRATVVAQNAAAVKGNVEEFLATLTPIQTQSQQIAQTAHQVGFTAGSPCGQLFPPTAS